MHCPFCNHKDTRVNDSRNSDEGKVVRRRRICDKCHARFTTFEKVVLKELFVIKRSGIKKKFDRDKIIKSMLAAVRKRNIPEGAIDKIADHIHNEVERSASGEIQTRNIGSMIMKALAQIDQVAYIRFASVYKDFSSAKDFARFIGDLKQ